MSIDLVKEKTARSRKYCTETLKDADFADDLALLANRPVLDESLLHTLEQAARGICFQVNANKTEFMCFKMRRC